MTDASFGTQTGSVRYHLGHQFIGVQAALHQRLGITVVDQRNGHCRGIVAMLDVDDAVLLEIQPVFAGDAANLGFGADQDRIDQFGLRCHQCTFERFQIAGVNHGHVDGCQSVGPSDQVLQPCVFVRDCDMRQVDAFGFHLFRGRQNLGRAAHHLQVVLIDATAVKENMPVVGEHLLDRHGDGDRVAQADRSRKMQRLIDQDGSRSGELRSQHGGDQRCAPHAVSDDFPEHAAVGKLLVADRRIHVARHDGEQLDVFGAQRTNQNGTVADVYFVEGPAFKKVLLGFYAHDSARTVNEWAAGSGDVQVAGLPHDAAAEANIITHMIQTCQSVGRAATLLAGLRLTPRFQVLRI
ncbi:hypothetical protein PROAA_2750002 [Candidatus Propionivibrio aalborgensis]|uniref:Uncharacterized protein n=1 Tax=Candidatus Propionivibrio aalborgensis TaxID=1860101 RepID=A0A1A8XWP2_9RHOO|nr:hypothetical protein PROAA_2750002 [Candidatus Propionivibrio aalborgensis]